MNATLFARFTATKMSALMLFATTVAFAAEPPVSSGQNSATPPDPLAAAYAAMGSSFAQSNHLDQLGWDEAKTTAFLDGMRAALQGKPYPFDAAAAQVTAETGRRLQAIAARGSQPAAQAVAPSSGRLEVFMKEAEKRLGLQRADNGLAYRVEVGRGGPRPRLADTVTFSCVATAGDGKTNLPALSAEKVTVEMSKLLPGFQQVLQMMTVGSVAVFVLPPTLSFGDGEWPAGVERGSPLIFQLTLQEVVSADAAR